MRVLLVVLALAGCGRFDFTAVATSDAAAPDVDTAHDEDGDGTPDVVDLCPHVADNQSDGDDDGVGDACDPHSTTGGDAITVFSPMTPGTSPFDAGPSFSEEADAIYVVGNSSLFVTRPLTNARVELGFEIVALDTNPQKQVAIGFEGTDPVGYFAELNDDEPNHWAAIVSFDATNGYVQLDQQTVPMVHPGRGFVRLDATAGTTPAMAVVAGWYGELYQASANTPAYTASNLLRFTLNGLDIRIEYLLVIESP